MKIKVLIDKKEQVIEAEKNQTLLYVLHSNGIFINAYCGGRGICRKCIVRFLDNPPPPKSIERQTFSENQLKEGYRLACLHEAKDSHIEVFLAKPVFSQVKYKPCCDNEDRYIAIDLGTTTVAIAFIEKGKIIKSINFLNPQIAFGGDVISRISFSNEGGFETLKNSIQKAILTTIKDFNAKEIILAANPTMASLFFGKNPKSIGEYPYSSPLKGAQNVKLFDRNFYLPPIISAFVGSDITSALSILPENEDYLFADIGTNCELILKHKDKYFCSSAPAGPALEGAGIDYGMIAQDGAIYKVKYKDTFKAYTINNKPAQGITGSGLISAIALLNRYRLIDKTGRLLEPWEVENAPFGLINRIKKKGFLLDKYIFITQNSIRSFQLIKASINAALEILISMVEGYKPKKIFIGGGFSKKLTKDEILDSQLLSFGEEFVMLGNSSLGGAMKLFCSTYRQKVEQIARKMEYIEIANTQEFEKIYLEKMNF